MVARAAGLGAGIAPRRPPASPVAPRVPAHPRFLHSAALRFAAVYVLLFGLSALALAIFLWWQTAGVLDRETDNAITADVQSLAVRWNQGGLAGLIITIENRLAENVDDNAIYLLVDPRLQRVAGNLAAWPTSLPLDRTWAELPIERAGIRSLARVRRYNLPGGFHLLVGRDVQVRAELRDLLTGALLWALLVVLVLGLAGAVVIRGLFRRALADVSATAAAISAGDLSQRVRISGRGDEFDRLSETINEMLERISRLMDGVREVSNAIAHDLRTPITRARSRLEDAALHARTETDLRAAIERATADLDGVVAVFQALLRIAEIEAGARRSAFAPFDLAPLLADLVDLYSAVAEERGISLKLQSPERLALFADRELLQQAIANLLDNALKFSPPGGVVRLSAEVVSGMAAISVADRGPGIPSADRARAAERFFRGEAARHTPGAGLGLALVQAVAQLHGGSLVLADNLPGLKAVLRLACTAEPEARGEPKAMPKGAQHEAPAADT
ncbi:MAG TPA: HAMP domain-containing sensor histidine kinase [Acetobacteraceae bacterium]|nr:HAMP domain-containing sensor histidine kinase [Acetobacteraceae bacterium]